jgi:hypothetical protein
LCTEMSKTGFLKKNNKKNDDQRQRLTIQQFQGTFCHH